ncbi:ABC transporter substrate-binding protein [Nonomuraea sp. NPDC005650]|uniref:ABC transporter substrate-binding protein n=1 Tax=Nonomuraea sp. NPDC005650 TaxID=3157045 RepID=UPI0033A37D27
MPRMHRRAGGAALIVISALTLSACGAGSGDAAPQASAAASTSQVALDQKLRDALPKEILDKGTLNATMVTFPPYINYKDDGKTLEGASVDLAEALSGLLGVKVKTEIVPAFSQAITGIQSGRYDFGLGPYADNADTAKSFDFVDWIQEFVVFAVPKGNPAKIDSLESTCGHSIGVLGGGSAETVIQKYSATCVSSGKSPVKVQSFQDVNGAILAVQSKRIEAYFSSQASLTYFMGKTGGALELAGTGKANGFDKLRQGSFFPKNSKLTDVLLDSLKKLQSDGTLSKIMGRWNLSGNELPDIGVNLGTAAS